MPGVGWRSADDRTDWAEHSPITKRMHDNIHALRVAQARHVGVGANMQNEGATKDRPKAQNSATPTSRELYLLHRRNSFCAQQISLLDFLVAIPTDKPDSD